MPNSLRKTCGNGAKVPSRSTPVACSSGCRPGLPPASPAAAAPKVYTVVIDKMKFGPVPAGIRVGDTILWVNRDFLKHSATARDKSFNVELPRKPAERP